MQEDDGKGKKKSAQVKASVKLLDVGHSRKRGEVDNFILLTLENTKELMESLSKG